MKFILNRRGRSFVTIMVLIAFVTVFLRFGIQQLIKVSIAYNESNASATLKLIATALENYAKDHLGSFPTNLSELIQDEPPYLDKNYLLKSPIKGYNYSCLRLEASGYNCIAVPGRCMLTGKMSYTITTGGIFVSEACGEKE